MKYLLKTASNPTLRFICNETPGSVPAIETTSEETERATVCTKSRKECQQLSTEVEEGLTTPPDLKTEENPDISSNTGNPETTDSKASPHAPHFERLRVSAGYKDVPEKEFNTIRDSLITELKTGSLTIPTDISNNPDKVNDWLTEQVDLRLEAHDTDPVARTSEYFAGQGRTIPPAQQQKISKQIAAARESGATDNPTLVDLIKNLLQELGFNFSEEDAANLNFPDSTGKTYSPEGGAAANSGREYNGEVYEGNFEMNNQFYNIQKLKEKIPENRLAAAEESAAKFPKDWQAAVYRNAVNNQNFSANQPILLHNISTATAALWLPGEAEATLHPATHGYGGVGNISGSGSTPIGSFELYQMADGGKYTSRMGVKGLESMQADYKGSPEDAWSADPAAMGNKNSDDRLIRIHQIRGARTAGCTGLPTAIAAKLDNAIGNGTGIMERFVSNPSA